MVTIFGAEALLTTECRLLVRDAVVGRDADDFVYSTHNGRTAKLADVLDDLCTRPFLGDRRLVVVEEADPFVTEYRAKLQKYLNDPSDFATLLLQVSTWPSSTNLAKQVEKVGLAIDASPPKGRGIASWVVQWAKIRHGKVIKRPAAEILVELINGTLGQLDQELAKLATFVGASPEITLGAIEKLVAGAGGNIWAMLDGVMAGELKESLLHLDHLLTSGEAPMKVYFLLSSMGRKLATAARRTLTGERVESALVAAGIVPFKVEAGRGQLRHLGRKRLREMYRICLSADAAVKGETSLSDRLVLERFFITLGRRAP